MLVLKDEIKFLFFFFDGVFLDVMYLVGLVLYLVVFRCVINNINLLINGYLDIMCLDNVIMYSLLFILIVDDNKMVIM